MIPLELKTLICKQCADPAAFHQSTCVSAKCLWVEKLWLNSAWGTSADITALPPPFMSHSGFSLVLIFTFWLCMHSYELCFPHTLWNFGWAALTCTEKRLFFLLDNFSSDTFHLQKTNTRTNIKKKQPLKKSKSWKIFSKCMTFWFYIWSVALGS